jgi:hypothetical protein
MAGPTTLFGLFGDFTSNWPTRVVQEDVGIVNPLGQPANPGTWLAALNAVVTVGEVRFGALDGRAAVQAELRMAAPSTYSEGWPFVLAAMPDVEFRIQAVSGADRFVSLFGAVSDRGVEIVLERLPVEIRLPTGLVAPRDADETTTGQFTAGNLDDLMVVYSTKTPTSVFVHVRLHMTEDMEFSIRPAVPISFGRCRFSDLPCLAVHDFTLIPSPSLALDGPLTGQRLDEVEWLRHRVTPWLPSQGIPLVGQFAVRSLHLDPNEDPMRAAATALAKRREGAPPAGEFVLDDAVVPFFSPYLLPIPRHITVGIRRRVVNPEDAVQAFSFAKAPIRLDLSASPKVGAIIESFFFRSQPDIAENQGL